MEVTASRKVNLGCPYECNNGWTCVDLHPKSPNVIQSDVNEYLITHDGFDLIYSKNLLEHLPNPGHLLSLAYSDLNKNGEIKIITDNAEFVPFYLPFKINHTGIGAHNLDSYAQSISHNSSHHYSVFTKMHLINLLTYYGFRNIKVNRITFGARLKAVGIK